MSDKALMCQVSMLTFQIMSDNGTSKCHQNVCWYHEIQTAWK